RAAHEGWIREGMDAARVRDGGERRSRSLLGRLRGRLAEAGAPEEEQVQAPAAEGGGSAGYEPLREAPPPEPELEFEPEPEELPDPVAAAEPPPVERLPEGQPRSVHAVPTNADLKVARAVELFNVSEHPRTVSGVARSLGAPVVVVRPSATEGSVVTIVVAWELSWYRYEVDLGNEAAGVRVTEQGSELHELDQEDQMANAAADETGRLHLAT